MTNYETIKNMNIYDLARFLLSIPYEWEGDESISEMMEWLDSKYDSIYTSDLIY